jgi:aspartyl-tRNA synthetase
MKRVYINNLNKNIEKDTLIFGWVNIRRDHGKIIFMDIRDETGVIQTVVTPEKKEVYDTADSVRPEYVVERKGKRKKRPDNMINKDMENGDIEMEVIGMKVLNKAKTIPFEVDKDGYEIGEENRLKYRYIDLRRKRLQKNIRNRSEVLFFIRKYLKDLGFIEIETPILSKSTPEGARDFIVPSRTEIGKFYALPQSPQQYKQLLMSSGFEKYFQIARCMRDEDTRIDRQAEFTQLDIEMSFITQDEILSLIEEMFAELIKKVYTNKKITATPWPKLSYDDVMNKYNTDRPDLRNNKDDNNELAFCWIVDFPLFEKEKNGKYFAPEHHMFTSPKEEDVDKLDKNPEDVKSYQHDLVLNGNEVGGGSMRISNPKIQSKIFDLIGFGDKEKATFSHMLEAFSYGIPPHGGIAPGIDRLLMILEGEPNIREVIAFPKTGEGNDLMMESPSYIDKKQLDDLGINIEKKP